MNFSSSLGILRLLSLIEGISYLSFAITVPLKRIYGIDGPNYWVGMAHGFLFIAYCLYVLIVAKHYKWSFKTTFISGLASLIPIGTFVTDSKIFKPLQLKSQKQA